MVGILVYFAYSKYLFLPPLASTCNSNLLDYRHYDHGMMSASRELACLISKRLYSEVKGNVAVVVTSILT
jgi:hypothetical protein